MNHDWNEEEGNFNLAVSQRTEELYRVPNHEPDEEGLIEAAVLPLRDLVIFPRMVAPIFVGREASLLAVQEAQRKERTVIGLTQTGRDHAGRQGIPEHPQEQVSDGGRLLHHGVLPGR